MKDNHATKEYNRKGMQEILNKGAEIAKKENNKKIYMDLEMSAIDMLDNSNPTNLSVIHTLNNAIKKCKKQEVIMSLEMLVFEAYQLAC